MSKCLNIKLIIKKVILIIYLVCMIKKGD
jgi:hypothetical protein